MNSDIQYASLSKRIIAGIFDAILLVTLAVLLATGVSSILDYGNKANALKDKYAYFENLYNVDFEITEDDYALLSTEQQEQFQAAYEALASDEETLYIYNLLISFTVVIISVSALLSFLILEFAVPLILKNGQTLGKKIFSIAIVRPDCVQMSAVSLFIRTVLGKFAIETMVPVLLVMLALWGVVGIIAPIMVIGIVLMQIMLAYKTDARTLIHDRLALTVAVDIQCQRIFETKEDQLAYAEKLRNEADNSVY